MDLRTGVLMLVAGLMVMVTCQSAPVANDGNLLTSLLQKANIVLDNIIAKQKVADADHAKQDEKLHVDQRNEVDPVQLTRTARWSDFLEMICRELQAHGLNDPSCDSIGETSEPERRYFQNTASSNRPMPERSIETANEEEVNLERTAKGYVNVISEICDVFRAHGIIIDQCLEQDETESGRAERTYQYDKESRPSAEKRADDHEADEQALKAEISEPERTPPSDGASDGDISLEKVLKYLQYLRSKNHSE